MAPDTNVIVTERDSAAGEFPAQMLGGFFSKGKSGDERKAKCETEKKQGREGDGCVARMHYGSNLSKIDGCGTMVQICLKLTHVALWFKSV